MKSKSVSHAFTILPAEYFRSHLLAFSSNLDDHNPDVAEWRLDVSRVIKNSLIQVKLSQVFSSKVLLYSGKYCQCLTGPLTVCECSVTSQRLWDMNLTFMMINDKARGRRGGKIQFKSMLIAVARTHSVSSGPYRNKVVDVDAYRRINVTMCLMCVLRWPEGMLGVKCETWFIHTWHVRFSSLIFWFFLQHPRNVNTILIPSKKQSGPCIMFSHFLILQNQNWCQKYTRLFSLQWTCLFCYLLLTSLFHDNPRLEGRTLRKKNKKTTTFRWKYDMIA